MPKPKVPKALAVDGTDKLAAKAKPGDKHEKPDLTIEEATVASPRPSRKRAGDYFDFEAEEGDDAEESSKPTEAKATPPKKKTKTTTADKEEKKTKNAKSTKDDASAKLEKKDKKEKKPKVAKDNAAPKKEKGEPKSKPKKSNAEAAKELVEDAATSVSPDVAMDQGPFEKLVDSDKGKAPATTKGAKKPAKEPKAPKETKAPKAKTPTTTTTTATQKAADVADAVAKEVKGAAEKTKKAVKDKAPTLEGPAEVADAVTKEAKAGAEKVKKAAKTKAPKTETPADVAESAKKGAKEGADKLKKTAKAKAPKADTVAKAADETKKQAKAGVEKAKKAVKPKEDKKTEATTSKKRKSPSGDDSNTLKADLLDPLVEHTEQSTKKKQKTEKTMSKSLGDAVGGLIASAAEGANAARASLGGFASSFLGGASEAGESAGEAAKTGAKKAKGKGKAIAGDVAESSAKVAAPSPFGEDEEDDSDAEPDDHTAALLAGFESDGDDVHPPGPGFQPGQKLPELPDAKATAKKLKGIKASADEEPGVVYVGRVPHGFYEHEMRQYFSQFGDISRLRLARNKKTGASRHWAFIEFKSASVANIVAGTMDNYLMFNHILKCKVVPKEQLHEDLWKGANKRFKEVPWNSIEGRKLEMAVGRDQWAGRVKNEKKRRDSKNKKLKETLGYEFEGGALKDVDTVPVKDTAKEVTDETVEEEKSLVTAGGEEGQGPVIVSEEIMTKKIKKAPKGDIKEITTTIAKKTKRALEAGEEAAESATKKAKKAKKPST